MAKYMTVGDFRDRLAQMLAEGRVAEDYRVVLSWTDPNQPRDATPVREMSAVDHGVPETLVLTPGTDQAVPPLTVGTLARELGRMTTTGWITPQYRLGAAKGEVEQPGAWVGYVQALCVTGRRLELSMWQVQPEFQAELDLLAAQRVEAEAREQLRIHVQGAEVIRRLFGDL
jgi:hypothetical protein